MSTGNPSGPACFTTFHVKNSDGDLLQTQLKFCIFRDTGISNLSRKVIPTDKGIHKMKQKHG